VDAKTLRVLAVGGVLVAAAGGGIYALTRGGDEPRPKPKDGDTSGTSQPVADTPSPPRVFPPPPAPKKPPPQATEPREPLKVPDLHVPLRPLDKQILARLPKGLAKGTVADAFPKAAWKVELAADGSDRKKIGRIEVDSDRDGRGDERWRLGADGEVRREVRTDDRVYREDVYLLKGEEWQLVSGTGQSATPSPPPEIVPLRPVDTEVFALAKKGSPVDIPDASPGKPYKIGLFHERGGKSLSRAKIDLDRDGKWDEIWWVDLPLAKREVSPNDDERYTDVYRLRNGKWLKRSNPK
jgi:hypothetical protein